MSSLIVLGEPIRAITDALMISRIRPACGRSKIVRELRLMIFCRDCDTINSDGWVHRERRGPYVTQFQFTRIVAIIFGATLVESCGNDPHREASTQAMSAQISSPSPSLTLWDKQRRTMRPAL